MDFKEKSSQEKSFGYDYFHDKIRELDLMV